MKHLPNTITLLNLVSGFAGSVFVFQHRYDFVLICALLCLISDTVDGLVARYLRISSEVGKQLDSLADIVSFGVLPGCILASLYSANCADSGPVALLAPAIIPAATALRLAIFNSDTRDGRVFYGLPSPSSAAVVFGILLLAYIEPGSIGRLLCNPFMFIALPLVLAAMLLSNIRLWSIKGINTGNGKAILAFLFFLSVIIIWIFGAAAVPVMVAAYIALGIVNIWIKAY